MQPVELRSRLKLFLFVTVLSLLQSATSPCIRSNRFCGKNKVRLVVYDGSVKRKKKLFKKETISNSLSIKN
jgi:hypothetical protein